MRGTARAAFISCSCISIFAATAAANYPSDPFAETQTITVANPVPFEDLGSSLAVSNGLAISGAISGTNAAGKDTGAAYVYRQSTAGQWSQVAKLLPSDGESGDIFGWSVGLDGDSAVVSSLTHGFQTSANYGATYFFHRESDSNWTQTNEFPALPNTVMSYSSVSVSGPRAVASGTLIPKVSQYQGIVEVFKQADPVTWTNTQRITLPGPFSGVQDVAISNSTLAVGSVRQDTAGGTRTNSVEIYEDSANGFTHSTSLALPSMSDDFGASLALEDDRLLVSAPEESGHGAAYIYERGANDTWTQVAHLVPNDTMGRYLVGLRTALDGDFAYLTLSNSTNNFGGDRVDVFQRNSAGNWSQIAELTSSLAQSDFGFSLAAYNGQALVGSSINSPGMIHVFSQVPEPQIPAYIEGLVVCLMLGLPRGMSRMRQV